MASVTTKPITAEEFALMDDPAGSQMELVRWGGRGYAAIRGTELDAADTVDRGGVLPGFSCLVSDLFA